jgi:uncharacterized membrane protein
MLSYNKIAGKRSGRIEALSDGVFAIAMTILVFDLKDPVSNLVQTDEALLDALAQMTPKFLSYFLSFMTLGIFWMGQTTQFHFIEKYDRNLNWISLFFLLFVSLIPFTTNVLSNHITNRVSVFLYWLNILAMGLLIFLHWNYAYKKNYLTLDGEERIAVNKAIRNRIIVAQSLYAFGTMLCFINIYLSLTFNIAVQLNYALGIVTPKNNK